MQKSNLKYNTEQIGFISGMLVPIIVIISFYLYRDAESLKIFFEGIIHIGVFSELISLCVVPNLLLFFIFIWTNRLKSARGVIGATLIYVLIVLGLKLFS
ncbi:MAG: hypothetical protein DRJ10_19705 [Bacteroidetes bacterium]|nr:MAG: hypothetical protein DRJ10_19705 [Bacteroidota bacterium]